MLAMQVMNNLKEKLKLFLIGIILYLSKRLFFKIGTHWFDELRNQECLDKDVDILRKKFWKSFILVLTVTGFTVSCLAYSGHTTINEKLLLRIIAIVIALTATLGRGGWDIQTWDGKTIIERIDRGMFVLSQLGATVLLLFILTMN